MSYFCIGLVRGYSAPAIPSIKEIDFDLLPTKDIASGASKIWLIKRKILFQLHKLAKLFFQIGSIAPAGAFAGSLVAGPLMHFISRKYTILTAATIWVISWILIASATYWPVLLAGRVLSGFCVGLTLPSAQIYAITECTDPKIRGIIGSFPSIAMSGGILTCYILGSFLSWYNLALQINFKLAVFLTLIMITMPRSPVWLRSKNLKKEAEKSSRWLGLENIPESGRRSFPQKHASNENHHSWKTITSRPVLMPLTIGLTLLAIQQLSGIDSIIFFTVEIFRSSVSLIVFMVGFSFGFGSIPYLLMGEIFPAAQRSLLSSIAGSMNFGIMFLVIKTYHPLGTHNEQ
ncbi:hypothetical protein HA402_010755 [Bradysia odoriphaga]|nr:hypothetical protein HA402_010755 [Bradysia odoriphaga]